LIATLAIIGGVVWFAVAGPPSLGGDRGATAVSDISEPLGNTERAVLNVDFAAGQLTIDRLAGSDKLIEGTLSLVTSRKPTWGIDRSGGQVTMSLGYEPGQAPTGLSWGKGEEWHLRLAPKVGFDLDLSMG